jgi:hypothetical protein
LNFYFIQKYSPVIPAEAGIQRPKQARRIKLIPAYLDPRLFGARESRLHNSAGEHQKQATRSRHLLP